MKKLKLFTVILPLFVGLNSISQQRKIEDIKVFEAAGDIDGVGYYSVYQADGEKGKFRDYTLKFFDYQHKEMSSKIVQLSKYANVSSSATNDSHLAITFSDYKLKNVTVKSFDKSGSVAGTIKLSENAVPTADIYNTPFGFVVIHPITKSAMSMKREFEIICLDNEMQVLWKKILNDDNVRAIVDVEADENHVAIVYSEGKGFKTENYNQHMMKVSVKGELIFDAIFASNYFYFPNKILFEGDNLYIFGSFPEVGKSKPVGVFAIEFDEFGEITQKKEIDFKSKITPQIKDIMIDDDINMKEVPQFIVNEVIKTENGFKVITETIRLRPSVGLSAEVSTGGGGNETGLRANTTFIMGDFLVLNFSPTLDLGKIQVITKEKNKVVFEGTIFNVNQYHHILQKSNVSNFQFCTENADGNPSMVYTIRESYRSRIQVGVADLSTTEKVTSSPPIKSDIEKMKDIGNFGVLKNEENKLTVFLYKKGTLLFYDLKY